METSKKVNSLRRMLGAIFTRVFKWETIIVLEKILADRDAKMETKVEVGLKLVQRDDFPKIANKFKRFETNVEEMFESGNKSGNLCIVAEIRGEIVHWTWVAFKEAYASEIERKIRINSDSVYTYASYTVSEYRGLGVAPKTLETILSYLHERGFRNAVTLVRSNNFPSLRCDHKVGFKKIGVIRFLKIWKLKLYSYKGETKRDYNTLIEMFSIK